ncbi:Alpha-Beta hydrolase fold [Babesia duncani]|uniref:Alpha-Beta hydrolase fold n=1 Tax=Babesia duncani TaxID=323732 RepID=A0AAD9UP06_9APIC|nr:Alpha-Beta hydrolase fold [Babesia duncani]
MGQTQSLANGIIFPAPESSYDENLPELLWVPKKYGYTNSGRVLDSVKGKFPALYLPAPKPTRYMILYCHANSCDIGHIRPELRLLGNELNVSIFAIEYPGYGLCPASQSTTANGIDVRARAAFYYLLEHGLKPSQIILFGRSIGTGNVIFSKIQKNIGPAAALAAHLKSHEIICGGLVLQAPYISIHRIVSDYVSFGSWIVDNYWDTAKNLSIMAPVVPLLVIHGILDEIIPVEHGESLYNGYNSKIKMGDFQPNSKHNSYSIMEDLVAPIAKFLLEFGLAKDEAEIKFCPLSNNEE